MTAPKKHRKTDSKERVIFEVVSDDEALLLHDDDGPQPVDWTEFWGKDPEPIRYLVEPLLAEGEVTRVYAQAKVGKSLLIQECAAALATGNSVLGQDVERIGVLYIDQENTHADWKTRLSDMGYGKGDDWSRFHWYSLQQWPPLDTKAGGALVVARVQQHGARLVVLDTQSKFLEGEEDKLDTQGNFYRNTLMPLKDLGVSVVIIDHAGNDPMKPRGSSGKRDDVDTVWRVTERGKDALTLIRTHQRSRHEVDKFFLDRVGDPLRHVIPGAVAKDEQIIGECVEAIKALDLPPGKNGRVSGRKVIETLRATRKAAGLKGFRDDVVWSALRRLNGDDT